MTSRDEWGMSFSGAAMKQSFEDMAASKLPPESSPASEGGAISVCPHGFAYGAFCDECSKPIPAQPSAPAAAPAAGETLSEKVDRALALPMSEFDREYYSDLPAAVPEAVTDVLNSLKVIDRTQRYRECRSDLLEQYMHELLASLTLLHEVLPLLTSAPMMRRKIKEFLK